jgi:hypothetical protein
LSEWLVAACGGKRFAENPYAMMELTTPHEMMLAPITVVP